MNQDFIGPFPKIFLAEMAIMLLMAIATLYIFGFDYKIGNNGEPIASFPGLLGQN